MNEIELFDISIKVLTHNLSVLRKICGITQSELADIIGLSRQTISNIESGNQKMKRPTFMAIMFLFSLDQNTALYLKNIGIPYKDLKKWLYQKAKR